MSMAPRPCRKPPSTVPENGGCSHPSASPGATMFEIAAKHPAGKAINEKNAARRTGTDYHPGAVRFYKEIGLIESEAVGTDVDAAAVTPVAASPEADAAVTPDVPAPAEATETAE